jgi:hypothetical protein
MARAWSSEEEWRQVAIPRRGVRPQDIEAQVAPGQARYLQGYMRRGRKPLVLNEVIVGPNQDFHLAERTVRQILAAAGYPSDAAPMPRVVHSEATGT